MLARMDPQKMQEMLAGLWQQHRPAILERIEIIERAHQALVAGSLTAAQWQEATSAAHKLAGVLGTFSRQDGTNLARKIENWPTDDQGLPTDSEALKSEISALRNAIS